MNKVVVLATLVLLVTIGLSAYAYTVYLPSVGSNGTSLAGPGTGTLNIYLTDKPPMNAALKSLLVNVSSITLKYSENATGCGASSTTTSTSVSSSTSSGATTSTTSSGTATSSSGGEETHRFVYNLSSGKGTNVNITGLSGNKILLGSPKVPAGEVVGLIFNITGAKAVWTDGNSTLLKVVANGKLMIPVHFVVQSGGTYDLTADIVPGDIHISHGQTPVLSPVIHVTVVSGETCSTTTVTSSKVTSTTTTASTSSLLTTTSSAST